MKLAAPEIGFHFAMNPGTYAKGLKKIDNLLGLMFQVRIIVRDGKLPERDNMRYVPFGVPTHQRANLNAYAIAYLYFYWRRFQAS